MKKARWIWLLLAVLAVLVVAEGCKKGAITLTYGKTSGKSRRYSQTTVGDVATTIRDKTAETEIESRLIFSETVSETQPEGQLEERIVYESGWIKTGKNRQELPIKGKVVIVQMDKTGQVLEVKGLTELLAGQKMSLDLRRLLEENQLIFPTKLLKVGDRWSYEKAFDLANIGKLELKAKAKLAGWGKKGNANAARIESSLEGSMQGERKFQDVTFVLKGQEKGKATTDFDVKEKILLEHKSNIKGSFEVTPSGAPSPKAQALKTQFDLTTTITLSPKGT